MAPYVDQPGSDADGKSMAALGAEQAKDDRKTAEQGGYEFDADDMEANIKELEEMKHEKMKELRELAEPLTDVGGLGNEPVSKDYLRAVNESGKSYQKVLEGMDEYLGSYIDKLKDMVREYRNTEEQTAADVEKLGKNVDS